MLQDVAGVCAIYLMGMQGYLHVPGVQFLRGHDIAGTSRFLDPVDRGPLCGN